MFKLNPKQFLTSEPSKYEIQGLVSDEERVDILKKASSLNHKLLPKGGTSVTNPYKASYDVMMAENRQQLEVYKQSRLWSPQYTPQKFKYTFIYPSMVVLGVLWYIRYIHWPKTIMKFKRKGYVFEDLEMMGWIDDWQDEDQQDQAMSIDMTIGDLQLLNQTGSQQYRKSINDSQKYQKQYLDESRKSSQQYQNMQDQFQTIYDKVGSRLD